MFGGVADQVEVEEEDWGFSIGWAYYEAEEGDATSTLHRHAPRPKVKVAHPHPGRQVHTQVVMAGSSTAVLKVCADEYGKVSHDELLPSQTPWDPTSRHSGWRLHFELHLPVHPPTLHH